MLRAVERTMLAAVTRLAKFLALARRTRTTLIVVAGA
jgi:hypothetical protein